VKPVRNSQELLTVEDLLERNIAQALEQRDYYFERLEASVAAAKIRSAEQEREDAARFDEDMKKIDRLIQAIQDADAPLEDWRDSAATQRKKQAAAIRREIAARADELRRCGVRDPVTQAEEEIAQRWQRTGPALNRWLRRHR
jgi:hypothetical protein